jgi:predicted RNase H-like nuclease (RuvC/YqgF family)
VEVPVEVTVEVPVEVIREIPVEKVVIKEVVKEVPVDRVVEKEVYITDDEQVKELGGKIEKLDIERTELLLKIQQLETEKQKFSTKLTETEGKLQIFSTKTTEMENIFHDKMSKKDEELDELRRSLDEVLDKPPVEIVKEVYIEKQSDNDNSKKLQDTLVKLRQNILDKDSKIVELESKISELMRLQDEKKALYLRGSNLDDKLYK